MSTRHASVQVAVLSNISDQPQPGDSASEDDIGEELQACLAGNEEAESAPAKPVSVRLSLPLCLVCLCHSCVAFGRKH